MINTNMKYYSFSSLGDLDEYGQPITSADKAFIKISITPNIPTMVDNIKYSDATYVGLTLDKNINDTYVINYNGEKLKVLYVNPAGRYKYVYMSEML